MLSKALADLKAERERLGQTPSNSSRPPSTRLPWEGNGGQEALAGDADVPAVSGDVADAADTSGGAFLSEWLGAVVAGARRGSVSFCPASVVDRNHQRQCLHAAERAVAPVVEAERYAAVRNVELLSADETSWKAHGRLLWL